MTSLQAEKDQRQDDSLRMENRFELVISEGLSLVHDPSVHEGKTRGMAKGLFLCHNGRLCAGESAGLGLPVWKTQHETFFPTITSMRSIGQTTVQKDFRMDRVLVWYMAGEKAPAWFRQAMEHSVNEYMKRPSLQHHLLRLRDIVFKLLALYSTMVPVAERGHCRVTYETTSQGLNVRIDVSSLKGKGQLFMLNELDGRTFNRLRVGDRVLQEAEIPAWQAVPFDAILENSSQDLGISLSPGGYEDHLNYNLFCGREVGLGLDWAGLVITGQQPVLAYQVHFHFK
jgi:hypothetical protein